MSEPTSEKSCCSLAEKIGGRRLVDLDAELRRPDHRSFRKLAEALGMPGQKSAVERHKHRCLGLAVPLGPPVPKVAPPKDLPPVEVAPRGTAPVGQRGTAPSVPEVSQPDPTRARAPEVAITATSHEDRVLYIVSQMAAGTWDGPRDMTTLAASWGFDRDSVRRLAAEAALVCRVDRGTVEDRRQASMGYWRRVYEQAMTEAVAPGEFDAASKCLAVAAQAQTGWDRAGGVYDDTTKVVNVYSDPRFVEAAKRYVDTVQDVLDGAGALAERVAARLGTTVPIDVIAAVLAEADAMIAERVRGASAPPQIGDGS